MKDFLEFYLDLILVLGAVVCLAIYFFSNPSDNVLLAVALGLDLVFLLKWIVTTLVKNIIYKSGNSDK